MVTDVRRGLMFLKVDPLHHAWEMDTPINSPGETPTCLIAHAHMIVVGWKGSPQKPDWSCRADSTRRWAGTEPLFSA